MEERRYLRIRIVCEGIIKGCEQCSELPFSEGYCSLCRRPLDSKIGDKCNTILGYRNGKNKKRGDTDIICKLCNTITTI